MSDRLREISKRSDEATPGPWGVRQAYSAEEVSQMLDGQRGSAHWLQGPDWIDAEDAGGLFFCLRDAEFAAHAREDIPWLLAEIERLRQALDVADILRQAP